MPLSRVTITIPEPLVQAADARARALGRSRSWVLVEALRRFLTDAGSGPSAPASRERTPACGDLATSSLGPYRLGQLEADLRLSAEERVKEAEGAARVAELAHRGAQRDRLILFDRYEDYLHWQRRDDRAR